MIGVEITKIIEEIANDNISGSSTLSRQAAECLDLYGGWVLENETDLGVDEFLNELIDIGKKIISSQPTMAVILNSINTIISLVVNESKTMDNKIGFNKKTQLKYLCKSTQAFARKYILESKLALESIANSYSKIIHDNDIILTNSASSVVESLLITASESSVNYTIYVPESRPMLEGKMLAERLAENGIDTILIADSAMFHFVSKCTKIIVGADCVMPNGIINKIGTNGLGICAKNYGLPFYCVCETSKFFREFASVQDIIQCKPSEELYSPSSDQIPVENFGVKNIYFDHTEMEFVTNFLTENGLMNMKDVNRIIENRILLSELFD